MKKRRWLTEPALPLAELLAAPGKTESPNGAHTVVIFEAAGELYALDASTVEMIVASRFVAPVPAGPSDLLGIVSIHGRMRLAIDLPRRRQIPAGGRWRLIALRGDSQLAVVADQIDGVYPIVADDAAERAPSRAPGRIQCMGREATLLDPERLLDM